MENILHLFNINSTFFTLWDYQMSYIEFFGTIFGIWCVWLTAKAKIISWPIGIISTVLYLFLFYQIHLYSDMIEQTYFLITGFLGWWAWLHSKTHPKTEIAHSQIEESSDSKNGRLKISFNTLKQNIFYVGIIIIGTFILTFIVTHLDNWLPKYFPTEASFPVIDALTTVMSFVAQWLLIRKRVESWILWIIVDIVGIWLYYVKGVKFISLEYVLFLIIASYGLWGWIKGFKKDSLSKIKSHEQPQAQI